MQMVSGDVAEMDADADVDLFGRCSFRVVRSELRLNHLRALHGVHDGRKINQEGIPDGLDDCTVMLSDRCLDDVVMRIQQPQRASFIAAHLAAEADDVGEHDRGELALPACQCSLRGCVFTLHTEELFSQLPQPVKPMVQIRNDKQKGGPCVSEH